MPASKRTRKQREAHLAEVAQMYLSGTPQYLIAEATEDDDSQITYDLKILVKRWQQSALGDTGAAKGKELAKLDELERTFWDAWARSKQPRERTRTSKSEGEKVLLIALSEKEQRDGNPAFLDGVLKCIDRRCKILGLDAPTEIKLTEERAKELAGRYNLDAGRLMATANEIATRRWDANS